jgi:hypothetical protein
MRATTGIEVAAAMVLCAQALLLVCVCVQGRRPGL